LIKCRQNRIASYCGNCGHVENVTNIGAAAANGGFAFEIAALLGMGSNTDQAGEGFIADFA
jgi:hypothetical protein